MLVVKYYADECYRAPSKYEAPTVTWDQPELLCTLCLTSFLVLGMRSL